MKRVQGTGNTHPPKDRPPTGGTEDEMYPNTAQWSEKRREEYFNRNKTLINSMVSSITNIQDPALDKEDLLQEARLAFWLAFDTYDPKMHTLFTTYAHKCMKNAINEKLRATIAGKRRPSKPVLPYESTTDANGDEVGVEDQVWQASPFQGQSMHVELQCLRDEVLRLAKKLLKELFTPEEQYVFIALAQQQRTQNEIAQELGCSQAKISMTYKFVRVRLVYELQKAGYENVVTDIFP